MIIRELQARQVYKCETYAPYFITSYGMHIFNLMNRNRGIYYEGARLPNMRSHVLFVAPPGYMKSYYLSQFGDKHSGIFAGTGVSMGNELSMSSASFAGTISAGGEHIPGAAQQYADGIVTIDEFSALTNALNASYNSDFDAILLAALDHGLVSKRLAMNGFSFTTAMTMWGGVQPARYDMTSGLGRRMNFLLFLPTRQDNANIREAHHRSRNMKHNKTTLKHIWEGCRKVRTDLKELKRVTIGEDVYKMYTDLDLYSYESSYFDRILFGYHVMKYGVDDDKSMHIDVVDKELRNLVIQQKDWRTQIMTGVDYTLIKQIINDNGGAMTLWNLVNAGIMYGWNQNQVYKLVSEMEKFKIVRLESNGVVRVK